jgi:hypothetical protein
MAEQLCPVCADAIVDAGYEKQGAKYRCEPCATGNSCECGCCHMVAEGEEREED